MVLIKLNIILTVTIWKRGFMKHSGNALLLMRSGPKDPLFNITHKFLHRLHPLKLTTVPNIILLYDSPNLLHRE
jgi:hypothetical protein